MQPESHTTQSQQNTASSPRDNSRLFNTAATTNYPDGEDSIPISKLHFSQSKQATPPPKLPDNPNTPRESTSNVKPPTSMTSTITNSNYKQPSVEALQSKINALETKLTEALHECNKWEELYQADVAKSTKLESELKAQIDENTLLDEKNLLLSVEKQNYNVAFPQIKPIQPCSGSTTLNRHTNTTFR